MSEPEHPPADEPVEDAASSPEAQPEPTPPPPPPPSEPAPKRLTRSRKDRVIAGVCGGLGEYLGVDAVIIRIAAIVLLFAGGAGLLAYLVGWLVIPEAPVGTATGAPATGDARPTERTSGAVALGIVFVLLGAFFLLDHAFPDFLAWEWIWPVALIVLGVIVLTRARR